MNSIYCLSVPEEIQTLIQIHHPILFYSCIFSDAIPEEWNFLLLILPVEKFIFLHPRINSSKILTFGGSYYMEEAFYLGASDFIKDPWDHKEFVLRVNKLIGAFPLRDKENTLEILENGIRINGSIFSFGNKENSILHFLYINRNSIVSYTTLAQYLNMKTDNFEKNLHVYMSRLKKELSIALSDFPEDLIKIRNIFSKGYILEITCE